MKSKFLTSLAVAGALLLSSAAMAENHSAKNVTLSKVSDLQNAADDSTVYIQGYLIQNLGDEMYVFQDETGKINVEIDDDMIGNALAPNTIVWIAATVDNENGEPVTLEAEEIQLIPAGQTQPMAMSQKSSK